MRPSAEGPQRSAAQAGSRQAGPSPRWSAALPLAAGVAGPLCVYRVWVRSRRSVSRRGIESAGPGQQLLLDLDLSGGVLVSPQFLDRGSKCSAPNDHNRVRAPQGGSESAWTFPAPRHRARAPRPSAPTHAWFGPAHWLALAPPAPVVDLRSPRSSLALARARAHGGQGKNPPPRRTRRTRGGGAVRLSQDRARRRPRNSAADGGTRPKLTDGNPRRDVRRPSKKKGLASHRGPGFRRSHRNERGESACSSGREALGRCTSARTGWAVAAAAEGKWKIE